MNLTTLIASDLKVNPTAKSKFIVTFFRLAHASAQLPKIFFPISMIVRLSYRFIVDWVMGVDIPVGTKIGPRLTIYHGFGLVINPATIIGSDCQLRHGVTIGNKIVAGRETKSPILGDFVELGANCSIIGDISIGSNSVIGANTVVTKDLPDNSVAVGCNARIISSQAL